MKAFRLTLNEGNYYVDTSIYNIITTIENSDLEPSDVFQLEVIKITQEEFNQLPEFDGF